MFAALICRDKPDALDIRMANRQAHLDYAAASGRVFVGGPLIEDGQMLGSLIVLEVNSLDDARAFAADDPYAKAGLFAQVEVIEWKKVIG
jgi:uncharacterized protein YciI